MWKTFFALISSVLFVTTTSIATAQNEGRYDKKWAPYYSCLDSIKSAYLKLQKFEGLDATPIYKTTKSGMLIVEKSSTNELEIYSKDGMVRVGGGNCFTSSDKLDVGISQIMKHLAQRASAVTHVAPSQTNLHPERAIAIKNDLIECSKMGGEALNTYQELTVTLGYSNGNSKNQADRK